MVSKKETDKRRSKGRIQGKAFENTTRIFLEKEGYIVDKWNNNLDLETKKLVKSKTHNFKGRIAMNSGGFPDFIVFQSATSPIQGVESKLHGNLSKEEKEKAYWLLKYNIFSVIYISEKRKEKNRIKVILHDFEEKYKEWIKKYEAEDVK